LRRQGNLENPHPSLEKPPKRQVTAEAEKRKPSENVSTKSPAEQALKERLNALEEQTALTQRQLANISAMLAALTSSATPPSAGVDNLAPSVQPPTGVSSPPPPANGGNTPNPLMVMLMQKMMGGGGGEPTPLERLAFKSLETDIHLKETIIGSLLRKGLRTAPLFGADAGGEGHAAAT